MARRALGPHWKGFAPRERDEFVGLFRGLLGESFVMVVDRYTGDPVVSVIEEVAETFAQVRSRITPKQGPALTIEYRLSRSASRWTVYDILLDGVSLVSTYRSGFNAILGTSSVARLLERMRALPPWTPPPTLRGPLAALLLLGAGSQARGGR
jgi:phospholipid transport system substrate-binding protein